MDNLFNNDFLVASDQYAETMEQVVLPFLRRKETIEEIKAEGEISLYCVTYGADDPVGTVFILHGFTENAFKYSELIFSLLQNHFSVVAYDQRGHGRSGRVNGISDPSVTHVDSFDEYVTDLKAVCDHFFPFIPKPALLFAHSMGGAVASLFLEQYGGVFSGTVLCAPMIAPHTGVPIVIASAVCNIACAFGKGMKYPFFMKPWSGPEDFSTSSATDQKRFSWYDQVKTSTKAFRNSIPTYRWIKESLAVTKKILKDGKPEKIACPLLLFTAENDHSVLPAPQQAFIERVPEGKRILVHGARHEIYRSVNEVLFPWWHLILDFFKEKGV